MKQQTITNKEMKKNCTARNMLVLSARDHQDWHTTQAGFRIAIFVPNLAMRAADAGEIRAALEPFKTCAAVNGTADVV